jgi:hypothetical protein
MIQGSMVFSGGSNTASGVAFESLRFQVGAKMNVIQQSCLLVFCVFFFNWDVKQKFRNPVKPLVLRRRGSLVFVGLGTDSLSKFMGPLRGASTVAGRGVGDSMASRHDVSYVESSLKESP